MYVHVSVYYMYYMYKDSHLYIDTYIGVRMYACIVPAGLCCNQKATFLAGSAFGFCLPYASLLL